MKKITVNLGSKNKYDIVIGYNNIDKIGSYVKKLNIGNSLFIITDSHVGSLYGEKVKNIFKESGFKDAYIAEFPEGEKSKVYETYLNLIEKLIKFDNGLNKNIFIATLGGGVPGDIGGFIAATFKRGINYIQIPTTLLANVDSGIGGKVGIDFRNIKNLLGAFYQPKFVFVDLSLLKTLDKRELKSGFAEVIKYGVIKDYKFFVYIEKHYKDILALKSDVMEKIVEKSYKIKADVVKKDEKDTKEIRIALNYGHTLGHAVESASKFYFKHGEAISIGMVCANDIAYKLGMLDLKEANRIENLLYKSSLPVKISHCKILDIIEFLRHDKKIISGTNRFVLPSSIGKVEVKRNIPEDLIKEVVKKRIE
ncbi:MAG: 3-dehydroquinate synthase [Candidatus Micrarchaeaceae archaeon]